MNIFALDKNPEICARYHLDRHCVKMITEHVQMISTIGFDLGMNVPYKPTHRNHPSTVWARSSRQNMKWLIELTTALNSEYIFRYDKKLNHKSYDAMCSIDLESLMNKLPDIGMTNFHQAMPEHLRDKNPIRGYRNYYATDKKHLLKYTKRDLPSWLSEFEDI